MDTYMLFFIFIILIVLYIILDINSESMKNKIKFYELKNNDFYLKNKDDIIKQKALEKCQVPTLNTQQCYTSNQYECPIVNGSYLQCTNNYIPKPNEFNAPCNNRTFEMTKPSEKISENCYYNQIGWNRDKFKLNM